MDTLFSVRKLIGILFVCDKVTNKTDYFCDIITVSKCEFKVYFHQRKQHRF